MADETSEDQARAERAARIDALKRERPDLTWEAIADHVGVGQRAAQAWRTTGAISYPSAKRLAELFGVDVLWLLHGRDPVVAQSTTQLDRIEADIRRLLALLGDVRERDARETPPAPEGQLGQRLADAEPNQQDRRRGERRQAPGDAAGS